MSGGSREKEFGKVGQLGVGRVGKKCREWWCVLIEALLLGTLKKPRNRGR